MTRLEWKLLPGAGQTLAAAKESAVAAAEADGLAWRLPTVPELVAVVTRDGDSIAQLDFGVAGCAAGGAHAADGTVIDPSSDAIELKDVAADAAFAVALVRDATRERPPAKQQRRLTVSGYLDDAVFQQCSEAAEYLAAEYATEYRLTMVKALGYEFERKREALATSLEQPMVAAMRTMVVDDDTGAVVSGEDFIATLLASTNFRLFDVEASDPSSYTSLARLGQRQFLRQTGCTFTYMVIKIGEQVAGRIVFQLYSNLCPKTCQNFVHLCRGDLPDATDAEGNPVRLHYKDSAFYRVMKGSWIQAGDIAGKKLGNGGHSIYGRHFPDESFNVKHDDQGILGMANDGEHTNASSFYITMQKSSWMNGRYVAFGRVVEGLSVVRAIHDVPTKHNQAPTEKVTISDCGYMSMDA